MKTLLFIMLLSISISAQSNSENYSQYGELIKVGLSTAPFPHTARMNGHTYNDKSFPFEKHYNDSTVAIFIPKNFHAGSKTDFVIHFHGWYNNVDTTLSYYNLIDQFTASGKNAILIVPEGPRNAPDSFGGKLEDENGFKNFMAEVTDYLYSHNRINSKELGDITLSGHSGAYHVMSFILMRGGLTKLIKNVFLFDALYGETEKYAYWLDHYNGKLINIYTEHGGTKPETLGLMDDLKGWGIPFISKNEADVTSDDLSKSRLVFIYSPLEHNDVIHVHRNFEKFLKASQ